MATSLIDAKGTFSQDWRGDQQWCIFKDFLKISSFTQLLAEFDSEKLDHMTRFRYCFFLFVYFVYNFFFINYGTKKSVDFFWHFSMNHYFSYKKIRIIAFFERKEKTDKKEIKCPYILHKNWMNLLTTLLKASTLIIRISQLHLFLVC